VPSGDRREKLPIVQLTKSIAVPGKIIMIPKKLMRSIAMLMGVVVLTSVLTFKVFEDRAKADRTFGTFVIQQDASDSALEIHPADRRSTKIYLHVAGNDYGYFF